MALLPRTSTTRHRASTAAVATLLLLVLVTCLHFITPTHAKMHASERKHWQQQARAMFYHGYDNYMAHAFPWDELKPLSCEGRRWDARERGDLDDVLGGYSLTLIDSLDMLAIVGDRDGFARAVQLVIAHVSFDRNVTVSVFESTIRVVGGLVSAHMLASSDHLGLLSPHEYSGELLALAVDLATRLLPAFETPTGLPLHRINLRDGVVANTPTLTCPAAAGSLLVELSYLSRLSGLAIFEIKAHAAVLALWQRRSELNLVGSAIDVTSGAWVHSHVGIGAGLDSFFEYLLKYHLVSGNAAWLEMFELSYSAVETHVKHDDVHIEVDMHYGKAAIRSRRVSALQAFWPGLQVLAGDVTSATRSHAKLFALWQQFGAMPELVDVLYDTNNVISWAKTSPLRPELIESTYHLFQATRDDKYLKVGRQLLQDIDRTSRVACGFAAIGNIHTLAVEDRMDSYFLSETVKYLYLLFQDDPDVIVPAFPRALATLDALDTNNKTQWRNATRSLKSSQVVFSTEGHLLMLDATLFDRTNATTTQKTTHSACENALYPTATVGSTRLTETTLPLQIGVSIRLDDIHVQTLVAWPALFGRRIDVDTHVEAPLLLYSKRIHDACTDLSATDARAVAGRIVVVTRGVCAFADKALRLQRAGALGVVIVNSKQKATKRKTAAINRKYVLTDDARGFGALVTIPVMLVSREDAAQLHRLVAQLQSVAGGGLEETVDTKGDAIDRASPQLVASLSSWLH